MLNSPKYIVIHCTDVPSAVTNQFNAVNEYHKSQDFPKSSLGYYGGYQILIEQGRKLRYRSDYDIGAHTNQVVEGKSMNVQSLGVCWAGDGDIETPTVDSLLALKEQVLEWMETYRIPPERVFPHRVFNTAKTCPGSLITDQLIKSLTIQKEPEQELKRSELLKKKKELESLLRKIKRLLSKLSSKRK